MTTRESIMTMRMSANERWENMQKYLEGRRGRLYNSNSVDLSCSGKEVTEFVEMNDEIKDLMNAIDVTTNLINLPRPRGRAYFTRNYPINRQSYHWVKDSTEITIGRQKIELSYPSCIWRLPKNRYITFNFIMECGIDHKLTYPVKLIKHDRSVFAEATIVEHLIQNDEQFIGHLRNILEGL